MPPIVSQSNDQRNDRLLGPQGLCGHAPAGLAQDRCGYGPRVPMLVISPYAKTNFVDHSLTDQTSILRFVEDNWGLGRMDNQSFDAKAGSITNMLDFSSSNRTSCREAFLEPYNRNAEFNWIEEVTFFFFFPDFSRDNYLFS